MNKTIVTVILLVACIGLAVALVVVNSRQTNRERQDNETIATFSNQLSAAQDQINGLNQVNVVLTNDLETTRTTSSSLSNELDQARVAINQAQQQATLAQEQVTNLARQVRK